MDLKKAAQSNSYLLCWVVMTGLVAVFFFVTTNFYAPMKVQFGAGAFEKGEIEVLVNSVTNRTLISKDELERGEVEILGGALSGLRLVAKNSLFSDKVSLKYRVRGVDQQALLVMEKKRTDLKIHQYVGSPIGISIFKTANPALIIIVYLFAAAIVTTIVMGALQIVRGKIPLKKSWPFFLFPTLWLLLHLLAHWPGILSWDILVNYSNALKFAANPWIQAFTTIYQTAFLVIYPSMGLNSIAVILVIGAAFTIMGHYFTPSRKSLYLLLILMLYFFLNPLNIFMGIFQNRDVEFSWLFFMVTIFPVVLIISGDRSIKHFALFFALIIGCILIRKEAIVILPPAIYWSWSKVKLTLKGKLVSVSMMFAFLLISFYGVEDLRRLNGHPFYLSTLYMGPMADITSQVGWSDFSRAEMQELESVMNTSAFSSNFRPEDIYPYPSLAIRTDFGDEHLKILKQAYWKLMINHPILWLKNRVRNMAGAFMLNELNDGYPYDLKKGPIAPVERTPIFRSLAFSQIISRDNFYFHCLEKLWEKRREISAIKVMLFSALIPLVCVLACLPWLSQAKGTRFALWLTCLRLAVIFPIMPSPYFKYIYTSYLTFLFLPVMLMAELQIKNKLLLKS